MINSFQPDLSCSVVSLYPSELHPHVHTLTLIKTNFSLYSKSEIMVQLEKAESSLENGYELHTCTLINHCKEVEKKYSSWISKGCMSECEQCIQSLENMATSLRDGIPTPCWMPSNTQTSTHLSFTTEHVCVCKCMYVTRKDWVHITSHREVVWPPAWAVSEWLPFKNDFTWRIEVRKIVL